MAKESAPVYDELLYSADASPQSPFAGSGDETDVSQNWPWQFWRITFGAIAMIVLCGTSLVGVKYFSDDSPSLRGVGSTTGYSEALLINTSEADDVAYQNAKASDKVKIAAQTIEHLLTTEAELDEALEEAYDRYANAAKMVSADWEETPIRIKSMANDIPKDHLMTVYHQTSQWACKGIMKNNFRIGRGGWCGQGIYFALTPNATRAKAVTEFSGHGCMIEAVVDVGRIQRYKNCGKYNTMTLRKLNRAGFDSILFEPPEKSGDEVIIFEPSRIVSKKIIPFSKNWMSHRWYGPR